VTGRDDAEDFKDTQRAIAASIKYRLENIEMILQPGDKPCVEKDVVLRISPWWKQQGHGEGNGRFTRG
jgi:hypothetical protein